MADIVTADSAKLRFRLMHRMLGGAGEFKKAHTDMCDCTNQVFRKMYLELMITASKIKRRHQKAIIADFGAWLLWIVYKDTAYNPISLYVLKQLVNNKDWVDSVNKQAVDNVDDLYVNRWANTKETTSKLIEEGKLPGYALSQSEDIFVPQKQQSKHAKMHEEEMKRWADDRIKEELRIRKKK